ncbi:MAG: LacI family DNA-binding transcriptional regulator [Clostridiales Family XIII bacterium]|jgi:LacI family transcriptional regulator|nr:LacI family DNA-binding transcriptional regulator [Clostridiales Family XIII bacterium]
MTTIRKISEQTNLSIATVSKVLNGKSGVSSTTRETVLQAAQDLNYRPNLNARFLKSGRSRTLGVITEDFTVFNAPEIVDSIAVTCEEENYHYLIENLRFFKRYGNKPPDIAESGKFVHEAINDLLSKQVDGILYIGYHSHMVVPISEHKETKIVCAYCITNDSEIPYILYNDQKAAFDVTELLIGYGDRKIGMITGPADSAHSLNRTQGHQEALFKHDIPYNPALTLVGDWDRDCGYSFGEELIKKGVTAIFCHNDLMAIGVLDYCIANGITVGDDIRLIGFDNRDISAFCRPQLSTVALPLAEIGRTATQILTDALENDAPLEGGKILLDCRIVERESTKGTGR